jgi:hypothetical protein
MRVNPKYVVATAVAAAILGAPLAIAAGEGDPILGGDRNPSPNQSVELNDETEIIARTGEYGTRQSNKGSGGGAIYGCRSSREAAEQRDIACLRANNLREGRAFAFETDGPVAGEIEVGNPGAQPFVTNGRGKVENLNADMVDSTDVGPILAQVAPGQALPRPLAQSGSLRVDMSCGPGGDVNVTAATDEGGIIHGAAQGIGEGQEDWEAKDDTFAPGETFATGFDQSHSGFLRYVDDDEAVTVHLSTDEQGGAQPSCVAFGTVLGGPHVQSTSVAPDAR